MATTDAVPDSEAGTFIEIKGGSLNGRPSSGSRLFSASSSGSRTSAMKSAASKTSSLPVGDGDATLRPSKSKVTIATDSPGATRGLRSAESSNGSVIAARRQQPQPQKQRQQLRQRSLYSLAAGTLDGGSDCEGGMGDSADAALTSSDHPPTPLLPEKIPEGMAKLLRNLPDPRDLAPLVRSVVSSADKPSRHVLHFKSTTKVQRVGIKPALIVAKAIKMSRVKIGRKKQEGTGILFQPTFIMEPKMVPSWRRARTLVMDILEAGLEDLTYTSFLAESGSRILAAAIVQRLKKENFDRYRLVAKVRIAQKLNQGMAMHVACLWNAEVDRFSYVAYENSTVSAQAILFLVYRD